MEVFIQLTNAGADINNCTLSYYIDPTYTVFASGISQAVLLAGDTYTIPDEATLVRVESTGICTNGIEMTIISTTSTSTTSTSSTTSSTTSTTTTIFIPPPSMGINMSILDPTPDNYTITSVTFNGGSNLLGSPIVGSDIFTQFALSPPNIGTGNLVVHATGSAPIVSGNLLTIDSAGTITNPAYTGTNNYTITGFVISNYVPVYIQFNILNTTTTTSTSTTSTSTTSTTSTTHTSTSSTTTTSTSSTSTSSTSTTTSTTTTVAPCYLYTISDFIEAVGNTINTSVEIGNINTSGSYLLRLFKGYTFIDQSSGSLSSPVDTASASFSGLSVGNYNIFIFYSDVVCSKYEGVGNVNVV